MTEPQPTFSADERDHLEQELLELHFGCHEDPDALRARLDAEPALRALQREVLEQAALLEAAAKPELPRLELPAPAPSRNPLRLLRTARGRLLTASAAAAAVVLAFVVAAAVADSKHESFQSEHLHLTVSAPRAVPAGAPWSFTVETEDLRGEAAECRVRWQGFDENGAMLTAGEAATSRGSVTVAMPADLRVPARVEVVGATASDEVRHVLQLSSANAGPLVHVSTDRPVYRPGEPVLARVAVLDRVTLLPLPDDRQPPVTIRLLDAKGAVVAQQHCALATGATASALAVPPGSAGGPHTVEARSATGAFPVERAEIVVRAFQPPRLRKSIVLDRATYAPGARGSALVRVERLGGGAAAGATAHGVLVVDGEEVWSGDATLGDGGEAVFRFAVPARVEQGAARFVATVTDGGIVETELRPFVVPTGKVLVTGFAEGGELVAGVDNGLYLECTDPLGRPVDTAGELVDERGERVAGFETAHQGRARLTFVPQAGRAYAIRLDGEGETHPLPPVRERGLALRMPGAEVAANAPLRVRVAGRGEGPWVLGVFCRGVLVGQTTLRPDEQGELRAAAEVVLPPHATGVLRVTAFDRELRPVAERLVRRAASRHIEVALHAEHEALTPGERQTITVRTTDETGEPTRTLVGLTVADLGAVSLGSEPRVGLADHAQLFADVEKVEDLGDFFLGHEHGAEHADLLLGTRGWRRFVWRNDEAAQAVLAARGADAEGVLAREGFSQTPQVASNLHAALAAGAALDAAARRSERLLRAAAMTAAALLALVMLVEGLCALLRSARVHPAWKVGCTAATAALLFFALTPSTLGVGTQRTVRIMEALDFVPVDDAALVGFAPPPAAMPVPVVIEEVEEELQDALPEFGQWNELALGDRHAEEGIPVGEPADFLEPEPGFADREDAGEDGRVAANSRRELRRLVREFPRYLHAHRARDGRADFTPTIAWLPLLSTDARGVATAAFDTSDAVTTWMVSADAHAITGAGRVGQGTATFATRLPFTLDVKLPDELSAGDELLLPVAATAHDEDISAAALLVRATGALRLAGPAPRAIPLTDGRGRALVRVTADATAGFATGTLVIEGSSGRFTDRVEHTIRVAPRGFPHRRSYGGSVAGGAPATFTLAVPHDAVPGSLRVTLKMFPSPLCGLMAGLEGLLQEPHGCFEQASSSNYPNTLVLTLLEATGDDVPAIAARARELLPRGYAKITGYECRELGYEWFGGDPGHEALTAYGLLQFHDMQSVHDVDRSMVERTRQWLLGRRDGDGGYLRNEKALDRFGAAPQPTTDAYVTYALLQAGVPARELTTEVEALVARVATDDAYELAVIACALHLAERPEAGKARARLAAVQRPDGSLHGEASITRSGGSDLVVETTGFAVLAWLVDPAFAANAREAADFLHRTRGASGRFGATQATIVALRALTAYAIENRGVRADGVLRVVEDGRLLAERRFTAGDHAAIELDLHDLLPPGEHELTLAVEGGGAALPWACDLAYHGEQPADDADGVVAIDTALRRTAATEGDAIALDVTVRNRSGEGQPMALAVIGLPAGLELPTRVLEDLQAADAFAFWELNGRELALYWRDLAPEATKRVTLDCIARVPGTSRGPASRCGLYYTPDSRRWAAPLTVEVAAR